MPVGVRLLFVVYNMILRVVSPFVLAFFAVKYAIKGRKREGMKQRFGLFKDGFFDTRGDKTVWVHAVSVGETLAAVPLVKLLKERNRGVQVYFSTVTETGNAVARARLAFDDKVFYFPFDLPGVTDRVTGMLRPDVFVVVETEIWPNVIRTLGLRGIPAVMVNGRVSAGSYKGYMRVRFFMRAVLELMEHFNMQTAKDAQRIRDLGAPEERVSVVGNVKFDQACSAVSEAGMSLTNRSQLGISDDALVLIAGSTHQGEESEILHAFGVMQRERPETVLIVAPRHPERAAEVVSLLKQGKVPYRLKSRHKGEKISAGTALVIDTIGELAGLYRVADVVFVGGSWTDLGGHNILEPAAFGKPVFFGPNMHNFEEIAGILKDSGVGIEVKDGAHLAKAALKLMDEPERLKQLGILAKATLIDNRGALSRNVELIERYL